MLRFTRRCSRSVLDPIESQPIPSLLPHYWRQHVGNGHLFRSLIPYETSHPNTIGVLNSIYNVGPASKWGLSLIPICGIVMGTDRVEAIDIPTSVSLAVTGAIWAVYALLIRPQNAGSRMYFAVNCSMMIVNGYNVRRRYLYEKSLVSVSPSEV